jgi:O-antigen ligase
MQSAEQKLGSHAPHRRRAWRWFALPVVFIGYLACAELFGPASRFRHADLVVIAGALLGVPASILLAIALRQGLSHARTLFSSLKWWHWLWALTVVSALTWRIRAASEIASEPVDAWAAARIGMDVVLAFVLLCRLTLRRTEWLGSMLRGLVGALTVFGMVCLASTAWSVFPPWTLFKSCEYLVDIALLAAILESLDSPEEFRNLFNWTWTLYGGLLLSVWLGTIVWPHEAFYGQVLQRGAALESRLQGVLPAISSNDVGTYAAILGLVSLARLFPASEERFHKPWYVLLLLGSLVTMVLAQTRTAFAGFAFGGFFILLYSKRGKLGPLLTFVVAPTLALATMGGLVWSFFERGQTEAQLATLSSRAQWWASAWQTFLERPLTGFGAYAAGRFAVLAKLGLGETSTLHSDYLDVLVGTSIWGMIPFIVALLGTWWLLLRYVRNSSSNPQAHQLAYEGLVVLALLTFRSVFMTMLTWHPPLHFLAILGYAEYVRRRRRALIRVKVRQLSDLQVEYPDPQLELVFETRYPAISFGARPPAEEESP